MLSGWQGWIGGCSAEYLKDFFIIHARRELQRKVISPISKSPGAHHRHPHARCFREYLRHRSPGRCFARHAHQPVNVGAIHVQRLPSQPELMPACCHELIIAGAAACHMPVRHSLLIPRTYCTHPLWHCQKNHNRNNKLRRPLPFHLGSTVEVQVTLLVQGSNGNRYFAPQHLNLFFQLRCDVACVEEFAYDFWVK